MGPKKKKKERGLGGMAERQEMQACVRKGGYEEEGNLEQAAPCGE